jgi:adenylate cyclase
VKGKTKPVTVFEVLCRREDDAGGRMTHLAATFAQAFMAYRRRRFADAIAALESVREQHPTDAAVPRFIERCQALVANPPPDGWDGVHDALTK